MTTKAKTIISLDKEQKKK